MSINTKSIWEDTAESAEHFPAYEGTHTADIVIVGGGITGLTAALLLSEAGKEVVVLEALKIGMGTTGNSTGNLYATVDESLSHLRKKWNADVMKTVVQSRTAAVNLIEQNVKRFAMQCDFSRQPFTYYVENSNDKIDDFLNEELEAMKEAGLSAKLLTDAGLPFATVKALRMEGQAQFHPLKYVRQLARALSGKCKIHEHSRVIEIDEQEGVLRTAAGTLKTNKILLATHTPVGVFMVHTKLGPYREFGVAMELKDAAFPGGIFWGLNEPKHSVRSFSSGGKNYVMAIGDKFKTGQHGDTREYITGLESYIRQRMHVSETKYVWGGQQYRAADGLPYIGKHSERIYFLTGFATDGLTYGTLAAMIVTDQLTGRSNPWEETFKADRFTPLKSAKEFITENADNVAQYFRDVPWKADADAFNEVKMGEGKVVEKDQQKLAVYRDEQGVAHVCSAVCTHMKCVVNWNQSEKTWDCPCHGSRFTVNGKVIEGPALVDLPSGTKSEER